MQIRIAKINACMNETNSSRPTRAIAKAKGNIPSKKNIEPKPNIKPAKIFITMWPAVIATASRIPKEKGRTR